MTKQTFVSDEAKGMPGTRQFVEPVSETEVTFEPSVWDGKALTRFKTGGTLAPNVRVRSYRWLGFNLEMNRLGLPRFKHSRSVAKSVRVKRV